MQLNQEQAAAVCLRGRSVLVSAAAGAGKTRVLVERLMAYIREDKRSVDEFLLITFTRAAAGEMRERIYKRLRELEREFPGDTHLRDQLRRLPTARICTLDAYCQEIVSENAVLLGLPNGFRVPDDARNEALRERIMDETLDALYEENADTPESPFSRTAEAYGDARGDYALRSIALELWEKTRAHPAPMEWLDEQLNRLSDPDGEWAAILRESDRHVLLYLQDLYDDMESPLRRGGYERSYTLTHKEDTHQIQQILQALESGYDVLHSVLPTLTIPKLKSARVKKGEEPPDAGIGGAFKDVRGKWKAFFEKLCLRYAEPFAEGQNALRTAETELRGLGVLLHRFDEALWQEKKRLRCPDFGDIRQKAYSLLCPDGVPNAFAAQYGARFHEIMVDEYQDINALQNLLIDALSREGQNVFYVGDVRQSIYRFQLAEPTLFREKYSLFRPYTDEDCSGENPGREPLRIVLRHNYRSHPAILDAVNHVFGHVDCPEMGVLPEEGFLCSGGDHPEDPGAVEWLPEGDSEEQVVAARLAALCASGAYRPSDCVILLRSPGSRLARYRKALEDVGLDLLAVGGEHYLNRPEILQLRAALRVVCNGRDDTALAALLRGPLLSLGADDLAALRDLDEDSFWDCLAKSPDPRLLRFRERLTRWRDLSADLPPYELCANIMADTRLPGLYSGSARENLLLFPELLRGYHGQDLRGLEDWLCRQQQRNAAPPRGAVSELGAVRLMTIHKSKGLEFPVVVVGGLSKKWNIEDQKARLLIHPHAGLGPRCQDELCHYPTPAYHAVAERLRSENRSEELRLLYVAMTRAVNKLILSGGEECKPLIGRRFVSKGAFLESPSMGAWLQTLRDPAWQIPAANTAAAEALTDSAGESQPSTVQPSSPSPSPSASTEQIAVVSVKPAVYAYEEAVSFPAKLTATGISARLAERAGPTPSDKDEDETSHNMESIVTVEDALGKLRVLRPTRLPRLDGSKPPLTAAEKGTALHKFMQFAVYEGCITTAGAAKELERLVSLAFLHPEEAAAVQPAVVAAFFTGEAGSRLLSCAALKREQRFSLLVRDGDVPGLPLPTGEEVLLQGVIDCYFIRPDGKIAVMDFKTDRATPANAAAYTARYAPQIQVYAAALERMTGLEVAEKLLCFLPTGLHIAV